MTGKIALFYITTSDGGVDFLLRIVLEILGFRSRVLETEGSTVYYGEESKAFSGIKISNRV